MIPFQMRMGALESVLTFLGSSLCHQLVERSYFVDGFQMPLCARCLGLHLGFLVSAATILARRDPRLSGLPSIRSMIAIGFVMLPAMADVVLSYAGIVDTDNTRRAVTGVMFGTALAFLIVPFIHSLLASSEPKGASLCRPSHWVMMAMAAVAACALVLSAESSEWLFYAVAVAGVAGVFATMFSLMLIMIALATEGAEWKSSAKVAASAVVTPLFLVLLALLHDALR